MRPQKSLYTYVITALFIALIFVVTAYVLHIPTPATGGYIHLGDAFLYLAASILPAPFSMVAGGLGEAMSDALTGSAIYAIPTLLIKSAMALCFTAKAQNIITKRNTIAMVGAGLICIVGYYFTEVVLYRNFYSPLAEIPANLIQAGASAVIYLLFGVALDRMNFKKRIQELVSRY